MANKKKNPSLKKQFAKGFGGASGISKSLSGNVAKKQRAAAAEERLAQRQAEYAKNYVKRAKKAEYEGKPFNAPYRPPRKRKQADDIYNARRRMTRAAERYMKKAEGAKGLEKARYERMAAAQVEKAVLTYQKEPLGKTAKLAEKLGVTRANAYASIAAKGFQAGKKLTGKQIAQVINWSMEALTGKAQERRDTMAKEILKIDNIGSRFYGGLVEVWGQDEESRQHPNAAILRYFGAESIMDVLEQMESAGIDIYTPQDSNETYKSIQLKIQEFILASRNA